MDLQQIRRDLRARLSVYTPEWPMTVRPSHVLALLDALLDRGLVVIDGKAGGGAGYSTNAANGRRERLWLSPECITAHQDVLDFTEATA